MVVNFSFFLFFIFFQMFVNMILLYIVGFALIQLGKYNDAEKHLLVASTAFRDIYNTNSNNTTTTNIIDKQFLVSSSSLSSLVEKTKTIELLSLFSTLSNLASLYVKMEQYEKAKSLAEECLTWFTANLGWYIF